MSKPRSDSLAITRSHIQPIKYSALRLIVDIALRILLPHFRAEERDLPKMFAQE